MKEETRRVPMMGTRVDIPADLWQEMDEFSRINQVSKATVIREGIRKWLDEHKDDQSA